MPPRIGTRAVGSFPLTLVSNQTGWWRGDFIGSLGCEWKAASSPTEITQHFDRVVVDELPRSVQALMRKDPEDGLVKVLDKRLAAIEAQGQEAPLDGFVNALLDGCDLDNGATTTLAAREPIRFMLGGIKAVSDPVNLLRYGYDEGAFLVTLADKMINARAFDWGPMAGAMVAAALSNIQQARMPVVPIFGIRVIGTRWTFLRADFSGAYLARLSTYTLRPEDRFSIVMWGGDAPTSSSEPVAKWGLDYNDHRESQDLMRMIVALGHQVRELA